jgi:hypothetical protein
VTYDKEWRSAQTGRLMRHYPKTTYSLRSKCEKIGVLPRVKQERRLLLITGSGRCGTTWWARALGTVGLDVQHERTGKHGTASLFFTAPDHDWYPMLPWYAGRNHQGERKADYTFEHVVQITRHPLTCIPSMGPIFNGLNYEFLEETGVIPPGIKSRLLRCAHAWYGLNILAEQQCEYRWQLEKNREGWRYLTSKLSAHMHDSGLPYPELKPANRGTGFRKSEPTTYAALEQLDKTLAKSIKKMGERYGYK